MNSTLKKGPNLNKRVIWMAVGKTWPLVPIISTTLIIKISYQETIAHEVKGCTSNFIFFYFYYMFPDYSCACSTNLIKARIMVEVE